VVPADARFFLIGVLAALALSSLVAGALLFLNGRIAWNRSPRVHTIPWEQARDHIICKHCGGIHSCDCPRILKRNERRYPDGSEETFVEYSPNISGELWADVIWPEDAPPEATV
jgi:hypothetical protein